MTKWNGNMAEWLADLRSLEPWSRQYQVELLRLWRELVSDLREQLERQERIAFASQSVTTVKR